MEEVAVVEVVEEVVVVVEEEEEEEEEVVVAAAAVITQGDAWKMARATTNKRLGQHDARGALKGPEGAVSRPGRRALGDLPPGRCPVDPLQLHLPQDDGDLGDGKPLRDHLVRRGAFGQRPSGEDSEGSVGGGMRVLGVFEEYNWLLAPAWSNPRPGHGFPDEPVTAAVCCVLSCF